MLHGFHCPKNSFVDCVSSYITPSPTNLYLYGGETLSDWCIHYRAAIWVDWILSTFKLVEYGVTWLGHMMRLCAEDRETSYHLVRMRSLMFSVYP